MPVWESQLSDRNSARVPEVTNVACAYVTWLHHPGYIRVTSRQIRVMDRVKDGGATTLVWWIT